MKEPIIGEDSFSFKNVDWKSVGMGATIAVVGALLTYASTWVSETNFGAYTPIITAAFAVVANVVRKWISNRS